MLKCSARNPVSGWELRCMGKRFPPEEVGEQPKEGTCLGHRAAEAVCQAAHRIHYSFNRFCHHRPGSTLLLFSHRPTLTKYVNRVIEVYDGGIVKEYNGLLRERPGSSDAVHMALIDPAGVKISCENNSLKVSAREGYALRNISARLPFPVSYPYMVILYDEKEDEEADAESRDSVASYITRKPNISDARPERRKLVASYITRKYNVARIKRIVEILPVGGGRRSANVIIVFEDENGSVRRETVCQAPLLSRGTGCPS